MEFFLILILIVIAVVIACARDRNYCGKATTKSTERKEVSLTYIARLREQDPQFNEFHNERLAAACAKFENLPEDCSPNSYEGAMMRAFDDLDAELRDYIREHNL